ncbi:hypothetical protein PEC18_07535 [Paucibacter sp. O1-1]|nr:hypothetical protein [Paucibacter sp. O1-1]MDA3825723.1 hypothetical protein [Paucibacter sp. O1-1]
MQDDTDLWRAPPPSQYAWGGQSLTVSAGTLALTAAALRSAGRREAGCLWLGPMDEAGNARAVAVIMPKQLNRDRNYAVAAGAMLEVAKVGRPRGGPLSVPSTPIQARSSSTRASTTR